MKISNSIYSMMLVVGLSGMVSPLIKSTAAELGCRPQLGTTSRDSSKYYDLQEDGKVRTFESKEEGERKIKENEDRIAKYSSNLKTTSTELPDYIKHPMYGLNYFVPASGSDFATNLNFYGSGDFNKDNKINEEDYTYSLTQPVSFDPSNDGTHRGDTDLNGEANTPNDRRLLREKLDGARTHLNIWELETQSEQENHLEKALAIDPTNLVNAYATNWKCTNFTSQLSINFNGTYDITNSPYVNNGTSLSYDLSHNGIFRIPIRKLSTKTKNGIAHEINFVYISDKGNENVKDLNMKIKIEPQTDETFYLNNNFSMDPNEYADEKWFGYLNPSFFGVTYGVIRLHEYTLNNGVATITFSGGTLADKIAQSFNPFDDNGVEGMNLTFPSFQTLEYNSNFLVDALLAIENSETTGILYPNHTQITRTIINGQDPDPNKPEHYDFELLVDYKAKAGKHEKEERKYIFISDTEAPVRNPVTGEITDNSEGPIEALETIVVSNNVCKPDTTITTTWSDVSGNVSIPYVEVKEAEQYTGVPYLPSPDPYAGDTLHLTLGQAETPQNLGGWPEFIDDKTEVIVSYEIKELEWTGTGWYKKIIFDAQNECGNLSPTKVERKYFLPSANGIGDLTETPKFNIYPNPAKEIIWVSWDVVPKGKPSQLKLFDMTGKIIFTLETNANEMEINVSDFPAGIYLLKIQNRQGKILQQKIIIQK